MSKLTYVFEGFTSSARRVKGCCVGAEAVTVDELYKKVMENSDEACKYILPLPWRT